MATWINRAGAYSAGTVSAPFPGVELALADDEILVTGSHVIGSCWNELEDWQRRRREGWYHTGDLGAFDDEEGQTIRGPK